MSNDVKMRSKGSETRRQPEQILDVILVCQLEDGDDISVINLDLASVQVFQEDLGDQDDQEHIKIKKSGRRINNIPRRRSDKPEFP